MNCKTLLTPAAALFGAAIVFATSAISARAGGLTFDAAGNLFAIERHSVSKFTGDGTKSTFATGLRNPIGLCLDSGGNLFVSDFDGNLIYKFTPDGKKSTFASGISSLGMAFDHLDNLFVFNSHSIFKFTPSGVKSTFASGFDNLGSPIDLAFDGAGNLFVLPVVMLITTDGKTDVRKTILKFSPDGTRSVFASPLQEPKGISLDGSGNLFATVETFEEGTGLAHRAILKFSSDGTKNTFASALAIYPSGLACDRSGNVFVLTEHSILKFDSNGTQSTFTSDWLSPDKQWEFQRDDTSAKIVKPGTTQFVLDLSQDVGAVHLMSASVVWAPDSKRFAFNYSLPASHFTYETIALYQLRDGKWIPLNSPVDLDSRRSQLAQLAKGHLPKSLSRVVGQTADILKVLKWTDANTALLYASEEGRSGSHQFLFTLNFDAEGNPKIVKSQHLSDKDTDELNE